MKFFKKVLSLFLVMCMLVGVMPARMNAAETKDTSSEGFYRILHLDVGRKYFEPDVIKQYIDDMVGLGYNQLQLYLSDNQGFRFLLDNTTITTTSGQTYDLVKDDIVNGGIVTDDPSVKGWFRPSQEEAQGRKYYLTQNEMTDIIQYAKERGIDVVPSINMPGHMGAILRSRPDSWRAYNGQTKSSLDVENPEAVAYTLAILKTYADYFANQGCKYFNIGADEYGYDIGMKTSAITGDLYNDIVNFMNQCADIIIEDGMVPRAFSDFFRNGCALNKQFEVYIWQSDKISLQGEYKVINTSDSCYFALGSQWYNEAGTLSGTASFHPNTVSIKGGGSANFASTPDGAMMCIWCDRGYYDEEANGSDGGRTVYNRSIQAVTNFANSIKNADMNVQETTQKTEDNTTKTPGISVDKKVLIGGNGYYLYLENGNLGATTDKQKATVWTVVENENNYNLTADNKYLSVAGWGPFSLSVVDAPNDSALWTQASDGLKNPWYPNQYITLGAGGAGVSSSATNVSIDTNISSMPEESTTPETPSTPEEPTTPETPSTPEEPTTPEIPTTSGTTGPSGNKGQTLISGSFLQGWLCRDWSQTRWNQELAAMKSLGMSTLIIQSSYDWATTAANSSAYGQDWSKYTTTTRYSLYPTEIPELKGANNSSDQLRQALIAAKENNMTIYIGLISDDRWWRFGWGIPTAASSNVDLATDSYFAQWCAYNGELSAKMITEIWNRYGADYGDQIGGWYYNNEIWNFDSACAGTDNGVYSQILADNFNAYLQGIEQNCPEKPLMLSPYFNRTLSTGAQYRDFWKSVFAKTNFKAGDIFAPQDCIGEHPDKIDTAPEWIGGLAEAAATKAGLRFWVNNETFTSSYTSASVDRVISQIEATRQYAETHVLFSWNHYYNPLYNSAFQSYNDQLAAFIESQKVEGEESTPETPTEAPNTIDGGVEINGFQISTTIQGFRTVYSVESKIQGKDVVGRGLIYSLSDYVTEDEIYVGSENVYVKSYAGTVEQGQHVYRFSKSETATSFAMTMRFAGKTPKEFQTKYSIRAYALLSDGTYVYSDVESYTIYDVASKLYDNKKMNNYDAHNYLYTNILKIVNTDYKENDFDWNNTIVG